MKSKTATQPVNHRSAWHNLLGMVVVLSIAHALSAQAVLTVTSLDDSGPGTLRQAIADATPGDTIDFAVSGTITLTSGELVITNDLTIAGPGATNLTVSGNNASRVLSFNNVTAAISGLTVAHGYVGGGGGGIFNGSSTMPNSSKLTVSNCTLTANAVDNGWGGGVYNNGTLILIDSAIVANSANNWGGGISSDGVLRLTNTTVSGNSATVGGGMSFQGDTIIVGSTICSNKGTAYSSSIGGVASFNSIPYQVLSSIIAGNIYRVGDDDFNGPLVSLDFNLIQNTNGRTITGVTAHNIYGKDPLLGPLADNGGPTPTHALLPGSPAIDHGSSGGLATDQRGLPRIFNFPAYFDAADGSDIGAYELQERAQTGPVFTVNSNDDVDDGIPGIAHCSLREAINAANSTPGTNTINFATAIPGLMSGVTGTITLTNGQLTVTNSVNINGPGAANLTVSGNNASRVFKLSGVSDSTISGLTIADAWVGLENGGGIFSYSSTLALSNCTVTRNTARTGSGIYNQNGSLEIIQSTISSNVPLWFNDGVGGGICNETGTLDIRNSAIVRNGPCQNGGGIWTSGPSSLTNSTVSGNSLGSSRSVGGGIYVQGSCIVVSSIVCSNGAAYGAGIGAYNNGSINAIIRNSIIAGNSGYSASPEFYGNVLSLDFNLIGDTNGCTITGDTAHNIYNQDPKLGPLADLGGPTPTHALRFDSPAIDAGNSGGLTTDQRGLPRPIDSPDIANAEGGDGSDIGAYEADPNLRISGFRMAGADVWLSFNSVWGRTYRVESTDHLPPTWSVVTNGVIGTGARFETIDGGGASLPKRFYRAVLLLP